MVHLQLITQAVFSAEEEAASEGSTYISQRLPEDVWSYFISAMLILLFIEHYIQVSQ